MALSRTAQTFPAMYDEDGNYIGDYAENISTVTTLDAGPVGSMDNPDSPYYQPDAGIGTNDVSSMNNTDLNTDLSTNQGSLWDTLSTLFGDVVNTATNAAGTLANNAINNAANSANNSLNGANAGANANANAAATAAQQKQMLTIGLLIAGALALYFLSKRSS